MRGSISIVCVHSHRLGIRADRGVSNTYDVFCSKSPAIAPSNMDWNTYDVLCSESPAIAPSHMDWNTYDVLCSKSPAIAPGHMDSYGLGIRVDRLRQ